MNMHLEFCNCCGELYTKLIIDHIECSDKSKSAKLLELDAALTFIKQKIEEIENNEP